MVSTGDDGANARMSKVVMPKCRLSYCQIQHLLRDGRAKHHFRAGAPNELWITDATEFRILAGKTYLSPIIDCFDGMPISWTISATPDAEIAKSSLLSACSQLKEGEHPKGAQRLELPLSLARVDKDMQRALHREVDVEKGLQPGQRAPRASLEGLR